MSPVHFQWGNRAFSLAAENGCVHMMKMLMNQYDMATMKPNKAGVDSGCFCVSRPDGCLMPKCV